MFHRCLYALVVLSLLGCASDEETTDQPSAAQAETVLLSTSMVNSAYHMGLAAADALAVSGDASVAQLWQGSLRGSVPDTLVEPLVAGGFDFPNNLSNWPVDFDALNHDASDRYPNLTGSALLSASGSVTANNGEVTQTGSGNWALTLTLNDDVVATLPGGTTVTYAEGTTWVYRLSLSWEYASSALWQYTWTLRTGTANQSGLERTATFTDEGVATTATITVNYQAQATVRKDSAGLSWSGNFDGTRQALWGAAPNQHTVLWDADWATGRPGNITITVDGTVFGPYSWVQAAAVFGNIIPARAQ